MKKNHNVRQRLIACILLLSLFLQSCGNSFNSLSPQEKEQTDDTRKITKQLDISQLANKELTAEKGYLVNFYEKDGELLANVRVDETQKEPNYSNLPVAIENGTDLAELPHLTKETQQLRIQLGRTQSGKPNCVIVSKGSILGGMKKGKEKTKVAEKEELDGSGIRNSTEARLSTKLEQEIEEISKVDATQKESHYKNVPVAVSNREDVLALPHLSKKIQQSRIQEEFLEYVVKYESINGVQEISSNDNDGTTAINVIYNNNAQAIAVLKRGNRARLESFVSFFTKKLGLNNVATSYLVEDFKLSQRTFTGLIEKYVPVVPPEISFETLDRSTQKFINRYKHSSGGLSFLRVFKEAIEQNRLEKEKRFLMKRLCLESVQEYFALYVALLSGDMLSRNVMLQVTSDNNFALISIDNEKAFGKKPAKIPLILGLPQSTESLNPRVRDLIMSWSKEEIEKYSSHIREIAQVDFTYQRIKAVQNFLKIYPYANMRDITMLAFFNTPTTLKLNLGLSILQELALTGFGRSLSVDIGEIGGFKNGLDSYLKTTDVFTILKEYLGKVEIGRQSLEHFIDFLLNHSLIQNKKEEIEKYLNSIKLGSP